MFREMRRGYQEKIGLRIPSGNRVGKILLCKKGLNFWPNNHGKVSYHRAKKRRTGTAPSKSQKDFSFPDISLN